MSKEQIEEKEKIISDICPLYKEYGTCKQCNADLDIDDEPCYFECMANAIINNGYRKQEWISVEERLPYACEDVLVFCDGLICIDFICSSGVWYEHALKQVTHWMPLPEAPNMQREVRV